jgi:alpha-ketoglutarate-dependent taurine dioxygenase
MGMQITVKRLTGSIGADVKGFDLNQPFDDVIFAAIRQAFLDHACWSSGGSF